MEIIEAPVIEAYLRLGAEVIKLGLRGEGAAYLKSPCGRFWCSICGLEPAYVYAKAREIEGLPPIVYEPSKICPRCHRHEGCSSYPRFKIKGEGT